MIGGGYGEYMSISIHAPRVGSDGDTTLRLINKYDFNPRSPCGERRAMHLFWVLTFLFQSTLPVWGATDRRGFFFIHCRISIHAPRVGSDPTFDINRTVFPAFQSTLPVWGATFVPNRLVWQHWISIHAPRVGSDVRLTVPFFSMRAIFQSTLPVWGATAKMHRFFFCIFGKKGIFCDILQIGRHLQGIGRKRRGDFLSRSVRTSRGKYGCLAFAFRESGGLRANRRFYSQSVLFSFRIDCQGSRIAGCPFRGP